MQARGPGCAVGSVYATGNVTRESAFSASAWNQFKCGLRRTLPAVGPISTEGVAGAAVVEVRERKRLGGSGSGQQFEIVELQINRFTREKFPLGVVPALEN